MNIFEFFNWEDNKIEMKNDGATYERYVTLNFSVLWIVLIRKQW